MLFQSFLTWVSSKQNINRNSAVLMSKLSDDWVVLEICKQFLSQNHGNICQNTRL